MRWTFSLLACILCFCSACDPAQPKRIATDARVGFVSGGCTGIGICGGASPTPGAMTSFSAEIVFQVSDSGGALPQEGVIIEILVENYNVLNSDPSRGACFDSSIDYGEYRADIFGSAPGSTTDNMKSPPTGILNGVPISAGCANYTATEIQTDVNGVAKLPFGFNTGKHHPPGSYIDPRVWSVYDIKIYARIRGHNDTEAVVRAITGDGFQYSPGNDVFDRYNGWKGSITRLSRSTNPWPESNNEDINMMLSSIGDDEDCLVDSAIDTDGDGYIDELEMCDDDPNKVDPGFCGCGVPEYDHDSDGVSNCIDLYPSNSNCFSHPCPAVPDYDNDGDIDQVDFGYFQNCWTGESTNNNPECAFFDYTGDDIIGTADYEFFESCSTGPEILSNNPECLW